MNIITEQTFKPFDDALNTFIKDGELLDEIDNIDEFLTSLVEKTKGKSNESEEESKSESEPEKEA